MVNTSHRKEIDMTDTIVDAHAVITKVIAIIEDGFGDDISAANKSRLELAGTVLSGLVAEAEPTLQAKLDLNTLLDAIGKSADAIVTGEQAAKELIAVFGKKEAEATVAPTTTVETHTTEYTPTETTESHDATTETTHSPL